MALPDALSVSSASAGMYATIVFTDATWGALTFTIGGARSDVSGTGSVAVCPCVLDSGRVRAVIDEGSGSGMSEWSLSLDASVPIYPTSGTWLPGKTVLDAVRELAMAGAVVNVYQWAPNETAEQMWIGYWLGVESVESGDAITVLNASVVASVQDVSAYVSDAVTATSFPQAPLASLGSVINRAYGKLATKFPGTSTLYPGDTLFFCFPQSAASGIVVDDSIASMRTKIRYNKNDGTSLCGPAVVPMATGRLTMGSGFWVWLPSAGQYGMVDFESLQNVQNTTAFLEAEVKMGPRLFVPARASEVGSTHALGIADQYKLVNDVATDYVTTGAGDFIVSFNCPNLSIPGSRVDRVYVAVDVENPTGNPITFEYGLWNTQHPAGANWCGLHADTQTMLAGAARIRYYGDLPGGVWAARNAVYGDVDMLSLGGTDYQAFRDGVPTVQDAALNRIPVELSLRVTGATKAGLRIYGITAIFWVRITAKDHPGGLDINSGYLNQNYNALPSDDMWSVPWKKERWGLPRWNLWERWRSGEQLQAGQMSRIRQMGANFVFVGGGQLDDGAGTYTGSAGSTICRSCDIAFHLLNKVGGELVNTSAGTLGNLTSARSEDNVYEKDIAVVFGPENETLAEAINTIQAATPLRIFKSGSRWKMIYEEQNPVSTRFYRSTGDLKRIGASDYIEGSMRVTIPPVMALCNKVTMKFGHGASSGVGTGSVEAYHPLSQKYYGVRGFRTVDAPLVVWDNRGGAGAIGTLPPAATYTANYHAHVGARQRLTVTLSLVQGFYDLSRGHVVEFDSTVDSIFPCPAYRVGRLDYVYPYFASGMPDQANSITPQYTASGAVADPRVHFGAQYQVSSVTVKIATPGAYTPVANGWGYYSGAAWVPFSNVVRSDGGDPLTVFSSAAGTYTVSWDRPSPDAWKKWVAWDGVLHHGPSYWFGMLYSAPTAAAYGDAVTVVPITWAGRLFEVIEATRSPGGSGDYPAMDVVLQEVM
jgi:hypothetical protein